MTVLFLASGVVFGAALIFILMFGERDIGEVAQVGLGLAAAVWAIARLSRCGIYADAEGVRILNPLSAPRLRWEEIRRFELTDRGGCRVERTDGSAVNAFGIQKPQGTSRERSREAAMVAELNRRLEQRCVARA
jgi:hypothetical protein